MFADSSVPGGHWSSITPSASGHSASIIVPDAELLFRGEFKRAGPDLVLTDQHGRHHLIIDYFASEHPPALVAPNGASLSADLVALLARSSTPQHYAQAQPTDHANAIGTVEKVVGDATVIRNGVSVTLQVGDAIYRSDLVQTATGSSVGIGFPDGTALNLVANTRMAMSDYSFDPNSNSNSAVFDLVEGTFSFVAGKVAHSGNMKIGTPVATMGIRGTTGWVEEQVATITANVGNVASSFAVAKDFGVGTNGLYDLFDQNGDVIATVAQTGYLTFVTPQGPGQAPLVTVQPMTNSNFGFEQQILEQVFQTLNLITLPIPHTNPDGGSSTPPDLLDNPHLLLLENNNHTIAINVPGGGPDGTTTIAGTATVVIDVPPSAVTPPALSPAALSGTEGSTVALNFGVAVASGDTLASLIVSDIPVGATLTDGHGHSFTATSGFAAVDVHNWTLSSLTITPPNDLNFTLNVSATEENSSGGTSTAAVSNVAITVNPLAPALNPGAVNGDINTPISLNLGVTVNQLNGPNGDALNANTLASLVVSGIPVGVMLSDSHGNSFTASSGDSSVNIQDWNLSSLTLTADQAGTINLNVTAIEQGPQGNLSSAATAIETVNVFSPGWVGNILQESYYYPDLATTYYTSPTFMPPATGVVGDPDFGGAFTLAVAATTITTTFMVNGFWSTASFNGFEVADLSNDPLISSVTIDPSTTLADLTASDISFDSNAVWVNLSGLISFNGSVIKLDLTFDPPLDPSQVNVAQTLDGSEAPALNSGSLLVVDGTELAFVGTVDNTGTITVDGSGAATAIGIEGTVTLEGGGHIELSSSNENYVFGATLINIDNTISGGGDIGNGSMIFENSGVVEAQGPSALIIDTGANAFVNTGIIETNSGTLIVDSPVTGHGQAVIDGGTVEFSKASDNNVLFSSTSPGTLVLDQSENFSGHILDFGNHDQIDLSDIAFSPSTSLTYSAGHLTVSNGNNSVSLAINGSYSSSSFSMSTDGHGGTLITDDSSTSSATVASAADQILPSDYAPPSSSSNNNSANQGPTVAVGGHGSDAFVFSSTLESGTHTTEQWHNDASPPSQSPDAHSWQQVAALDTPPDHGTAVFDPTHVDPATHVGVDPAQLYALMQSTVHLH
jgi:hypothetical protein